MIIGNESDFSSWKCGKASAFTHIHTKLILLIKKLLEKYLSKEGQRYFMENAGQRVKK